ncbi:MAG: protein phosphatase 2C domain-containing protein [Anaerolineales bacterium]|nr:protein phosphatase 2C domain-containing protein [Anaerolineales bacterium]
MIKRLLSTLKKQFQSKTTDPHDDGNQYQETEATVVTKELEKVTTPVETETVGYSSPLINVGYGLSPGKQRTHNEDAFFTLTTMFSFNETEIPFGLYIVADGMGGHKNGEIASELAIRTIVGIVLTEIYTPMMSLNPQPSEMSYREVFQSGIEKANAEIIKNSYGGGTTVTAILIVGEQMTIAHVGDSRVYSTDKNGNLKALTRDHSLVKRLQELGQITPEEAAVHPQRNVLYRALGQGEPFEPEIISTSRPDNESLLVCSDGLWSILTQEVISDIIKTGTSPQQICDKLIDAANDAGGPDNISTIFVEIS